MISVSASDEPTYPCGTLPIYLEMGIGEPVQILSLPTDAIIGDLQRIVRATGKPEGIAMASGQYLLDSHQALSDAGICSEVRVQWITIRELQSIRVGGFENTFLDWDDEEPSKHHGNMVVRGPDWKWCDQDGGVGNVGIVTGNGAVGAHPAWTWVNIHWFAPGLPHPLNAYRMGHEEGGVRKYDVQMIAFFAQMNGEYVRDESMETNAVPHYFVKVGTPPGIPSPIVYQHMNTDGKLRWKVSNRPDTSGWSSSSEFLFGQWERLDENTYKDENALWTSGTSYPFVQPPLTTNETAG